MDMTPLLYLPLLAVGTGVEERLVSAERLRVSFSKCASPPAQVQMVWKA